MLFVRIWLDGLSIFPIDLEQGHVVHILFYLLLIDELNPMAFWHPIFYDR